MTDESRESLIALPPEGVELRRPRLLDQVHEAIRRRYFSRRTEEAYVHWIRRFIYFSGRRHPEGLGEAEVTAFLNHLAAERKVAASTQNQALLRSCSCTRRCSAASSRGSTDCSAPRVRRGCRWC